MSLPLTIATPEHLHELLALRARTGLRIGELLVAAGRVSQALVDAAVAAQKAGNGARLGNVLVGMGALTQAEFDDFVEQQTGLPLIDLRQYPLNPAALGRLSASAANLYGCLPVDISSNSLVVAFGDRPQPDQLAAVRFACGQPVIAFQANNRSLLKSLLARHYTSAAQTVVKHATLGAERYQQVSSAPDSPAGLFRYLLAHAVSNNASDIHLRPNPDGTTQALVRVDGMFRHVQSMTSKQAIGVVRHLELLSNIDFMSKAAAKEGRLALEHEGRAIDLRVSVLTGPSGDSVVLRVLDPARFPGSLEELTLPKPQLRALSGILRRPHGLLVAVGPTGSGKTTTLYTMLKELSARNLHVTTVEDPVEYRLSGVNQFDSSDFGAMLPKLLRHDPDVVMVGELRDEATARMALNAALTGHLVLSTLHANDSPSTMHRLLGLGAPMHMLTSCLLGIMCQRLVRLTCVNCSGTGCQECGRTGYLGRTLVAELAKPRASLAHVSGMPSHAELAQNLDYLGGTTLDNSILELARTGRTTWEEAAGMVADTTLLPADLRESLGYI